MTAQASESPAIAQAQNFILSTYGDRVSVARKMKSLLKFGRNPAASGTSQTVWAQGGNETYCTSNLIDTVSSSNAGDTQTITVEGHTLSGGDFTFVTQNVTLNGQSKVVLPTPLARANRIYSTGTTDFAGDIYCYEDSAISGGVPTTAAKIHAKIPLGPSNTTLKCATSISAVDYWIITSCEVSVLKKTAGYADFSLQIRPYGSVFRTIATSAASSTSASTVSIFDPCIIVPKNADVRMICTADAGSTDVAAWINGPLASVI
jgi:hypothetical protein